MPCHDTHDAADKQQAGPKLVSVHLDSPPLGYFRIYPVCFHTKKLSSHFRTTLQYSSASIRNLRNCRKISDTSCLSISPILQDKKPRRSPLRLRFFSYNLEKISCAIWALIFLQFLMKFPTAVSSTHHMQKRLRPVPSPKPYSHHTTFPSPPLSA